MSLISQARLALLSQRCLSTTARRDGYVCLNNYQYQQSPLPTRNIDRLMLTENCQQHIPDRELHSNNQIESISLSGICKLRECNTPRPSRRRDMGLGCIPVREFVNRAGNANLPIKNTPPSHIDRLRSYIDNEAITVKDLNQILHTIITQQAATSLLALVEEKLLNLLTIEDDDVTKYLEYMTDSEKFDYESLCDLFIKFSQLKRRPTPLLKAATIELCKINITQEDRPNAATIISALDAISSLNYRDKTLISKLMDDLIRTIDLDNLQSYSKCNLLRSVGKLRWRSHELLNLFFNYIRERPSSPDDFHVVVALLHVSAVLNYKPQGGMEHFYHTYVRGQREEALDRHSRRWLNYVWSLFVLGVADEAHIRSVLTKKYYQGATSSLNYSDVMKLLNLKAIAHYEQKFELECEHLDFLTDQHKVQRSIAMQKVATKVSDAINGLVKSPSERRYDIETPFGFTIDCELWLDKNLEPVPLKPSSSFEKISSIHPLALKKTKTNPSGCRRCALIYVPYDDTIANAENDVVGHRRIIARILRPLGYETIFLQENLLNRKDDDSLTDRLKSIIKDSLLC